MLVPYEYYNAKYGGAMSDAEFRVMSARAVAYLNSITLGKVSQPLPGAVTEAVRMAVCELSDAMQAASSGGGGGVVASETNDGISVTYATGPAQTAEQRHYGIASAHLAWTGLLDRRCSRC